MFKVIAIAVFAIIASILFYASTKPSTFFTNLRRG